MTRTQWTEEAATGLWDFLRQRPNAVQTEMRAFFQDTYGIKIASSPMSRFLKKNKATYRQITAQAVERGDRNMKRTRRKPLLITDEMAESLWEYIRQRPTAISTDMRLFIKDLHGIMVSKGTMCNFLRKQGDVYQKLLAVAVEKSGKETETDDDGLRCPFEGCRVRPKCHSSLQDHERTHTGATPFLCGYDGCSAAFAMRRSLSCHQKSKHGIDAVPSERHEEDDVAIAVPLTRGHDLLVKEFSKQGSGIQPDSGRHGKVTLRQKLHIQARRQGRPVQTCMDSSCNRTFTSKPALVLHTKTVHQGLKICSSCRQEFEGAALYSSHRLHCIYRRCGSCNAVILVSDYMSHLSDCSTKHDKIAAGVCIGSLNCTEEVFRTGSMRCRHHHGKISSLHHCLRPWFAS
jgi:transposase